MFAPLKEITNSTRELGVLLVTMGERRGGCRPSSEYEGEGGRRVGGPLSIARLAYLR